MESYTFQNNWVRVGISHYQAGLVFLKLAHADIPGAMEAYSSAWVMLDPVGGETFAYAE